MTRAEHLTWCKKRAVEYVAMGDLPGAMASMVSDLGKHEDTAASANLWATIGLMEVMSGDPRRVRSFIEGFN